MIHKSSPSKKVIDAATDLSTRLYRQKASLVIVSAKDSGRVLVVRRFKDNQVGLPCGKVDPGEKVIDAGYRELYEETGVERQEITPLIFMQSVLFEGTLVNVMTASIDVERDVKAADGFEGETSPFWIEAEDLSEVESRFKSFNILALFNAGHIK